METLKLNLAIAKLGVQRSINYPSEVLFVIIRRVIEFAFVVILWSVISKSSSDINMSELVSYFLIAGGVNEIVMARNLDFGNTLRVIIKDGELNNYLIKPIGVHFAIYFKTLGDVGVNLVLSVMSIFVGILLTNNINAYSLLFFFISLILAIIVGFAINLLLGAITLLINESFAIRNIIQNTIRVFSGYFAPLYLFPETLKKIALLLPFSHLIFGPTNALSYTRFNNDVLESILISLFWAIALNFLSFYLWRKFIKKYEATGI